MNTRGGFSRAYSQKMRRKKLEINAESFAKDRGTSSGMAPTTFASPIRRLSRKLSFNEQVLQTMKRNFSSPGKSNEKKKKETMKIILF